MAGVGFVHTYFILTDTTASVTSEGRTVQSVDETPVQGRVDELSAKAVELAAQMGQTHDIVCLAPLELAVTERNRVRVVEPARLAGTYKIDVVRTTRRALRLLCSRYTVKDAGN